jgi:hypothetical protein
MKKKKLKKVLFSLDDYAAWSKMSASEGTVTMKTEIQKAQELVALLGNGQIHTMTTKRPLKTLKDSTLVGVKESTTQVRAVAYENTGKVKALRESGVERSDTPSGFEAVEGFNGKVLKSIKTGRLHLNVAVVDSGNGSSRMLVDGKEVTRESIAHHLQSSDRNPRKRSANAQGWMRPAVDSIEELV